MVIKEEKTYNEIDARMEALIQKGTQLGGMDFLSEEEKEEFKILSEAAYNWEHKTNYEKKRKNKCKMS